MKENYGPVETASGTRTNWPALVTSGARFSVLIHAIAFVVVGLMLLGVNLLLAWLVDGRWLLAEPMAWWGAALFLHASAVALAPPVGRMLDRFRRMDFSFPGT